MKMHLDTTDAKEGERESHNSHVRGKREKKKILPSHQSSIHQLAKKERSQSSHKFSSFSENAHKKGWPGWQAMWLNNSLFQSHQNVDTWFLCTDYKFLVTELLWNVWSCSRQVGKWPIGTGSKKSSSFFFPPSDQSIDSRGVDSLSISTRRVVLKSSNSYVAAALK